MHPIGVQAIVRRLLGDDVVQLGEMTAEPGARLDQHNGVAGARRRQGGLDAGDAAADHQHGAVDGLGETSRLLDLGQPGETHAKEVVGQHLGVLVAGRVRPCRQLAQRHPLEHDLRRVEAELLGLGTRRARRNKHSVQTPVGDRGAHRGDAFGSAPARMGRARAAALAGGGGQACDVESVTEATAGAQENTDTVHLRTSFRARCTPWRRRRWRRAPRRRRPRDAARPRLRSVAARACPSRSRPRPA